MFVDKKDQGRALVLNNLLKDSNGELRFTLNSTGLSAGIYTVRIEALPPRGIPMPIGWLIIEVTSARSPGCSKRSPISSRSVTIGGVLITLRVASVPLTPTRTVPHDQPGDPHPRVEREFERKQAVRQDPAHSRGAKGRQGPGEKAERRKLRGDALQHRAAAGAQGPQHRALVAPLISGRLHRRQQHHDSRGERE